MSPLIFTPALPASKPQAGLFGYYDMRGVGGQRVDNQSAQSINGFTISHGWLGTTIGVDPQDPTWIAAVDLTCNVNGNFRSGPLGKAVANALVEAPRPLVNALRTATIKHLSQLTISPNPANGEAVMHFLLREAGKVEVSIQDITGFARATALPYSTMEAGAHDVRLPLQALAPGVYLVVVRSADGREVIRLEVR